MGVMLFPVLAVGFGAGQHTPIETRFNHRKGEPVMWPQIMDSALKVGLGASITGTIALAIAVLQQRHERHRQVRDSRKLLLEKMTAELSAYLEGPAVVAHVVTLYGRGRVEEQRVSETLERLFSGFEHLTTATYLASLLGERELVSSLELYWDVANSIYCEFRASGTTVSESRLEPLMKALSCQSREIRSALGRAFAAA